MPSMTRLTDITIGIGSHGCPCCGHAILGIRISGSPDTTINGLLASRFGDIAIHNCPHCGINMDIGMSSQTSINGRGAHLLGHFVTEFCGVGVTVTGSGDTTSG